MAPTDLQRAWPATLAAFFATGLVSGTWAARIPAVQDRLGLSTGELAVAVLAIEGGALLGLPTGAAVVTRVGSRRSLRLAFLVFPPALVAAAVMPSLALLAGCLAVWAAANSVIDVAMNAQGVELERRGRRPLLSGLHAAHSFGLLAGGLGAVAATAAGIPLAAHVGVIAALAFGSGVVGPRWMLADAGPAGRRAPVRPDRRLLLLGAVALCAFLIDGSASNWIAIDLRTQHAATSAEAAAGFTAFALALAVARLVGDRALRRGGRIRVVQISGAITAVGAAVAITAPTVGIALAGWAIAGAGLAAIAPAILGAAPLGTDRPPGAAIATVTTIGYLGSFTGPPLIGALAGITGLSVALSLLVVAALLSAMLARPALRGSGRRAGG